MSAIVFDQIIPKVARVLVIDLGYRHSSRLGRFAIAKHMRCADGTFRITQGYRDEYNDAISYGHRFLERRVKAADSAQRTERATVGSEVAA